ncbi:alginate export family protein [Flammeovirgaceae bacterium SG7u.111]|nr:alginate export family protein [Flammeovirgaceae bacterium SG7u.132]WPO33561.1 alginate export family protein [Flammeovirgaceae bacterium SG7u.111]
MKKHLLLILFLICLMAYSGYAQEVATDAPKDKLTVDLMIRPRTEFRNGAFTLRDKDDDPAYFISQRSRVTLGYTSGKIKIGLGFQNVAVWGQVGQVTNNSGSTTMINEAWAEYLFTPEFSLKVGRQALSYDDQRILGGLDWHQAGRWHDLALFKYEKGETKLHAGLAYSQDGENRLGNFYSSPGNNYKSMQMLRFENALGEAYKLSVLALNTAFQVGSDSSMVSMQTLGANIVKTKGAFTFTGSAYYQTGENTAKRDVGAWMAAIYGKYQLTEKFAVNAGTDFLSGQDMNAAGNDFNAFNPLYGTHHKFYGLMDYFYVGSAHGNVGLWDKYLGVSAAVAPKFNLALNIHNFSSAGVIFANGEEQSKGLGTEADLTFTWGLAKNAKLVGGYSQMFASDSMEVIKGGGDSSLGQNWLWAMLIINPRIFESK